MIKNVTKTTKSGQVSIISNGQAMGELLRAGWRRSEVTFHLFQGSWYRGYEGSGRVDTEDAEYRANPYYRS